MLRPGRWPLPRRLAAWRDLRRRLASAPQAWPQLLCGFLAALERDGADPGRDPHVWPSPWEILAHGSGPLGLATLGAATLAAVGVPAAVGLARCGPHDHGEPVIVAQGRARGIDGTEHDVAEVEILAVAVGGPPPRWLPPDAYTSPAGGSSGPSTGIGGDHAA